MENLLSTYKEKMMLVKMGSIIRIAIILEQKMRQVELMRKQILKVNQWQLGEKFTGKV